MQKIAIIDDFEESCQLMSEILSPHFECSYICQAEKALDYVKGLNPDLILMDYKMPFVTGVELCKAIKDTADIKKIPIIFVSGAVTSDERIETLEAGGDDFLAKPFHPKELLLRVQKRLKDYSKDNNNELVAANLRMNLHSRQVYVNEVEVTLTPKQFEILKLLLDNKNNLVSRTQFMTEIWGHFDVTPRNVDSQINYLKKKIDGFSGMITAVPSFGYRLDIKN
ncbi:MAG: response regulator transcription factor [Bdellovibrio sp.]|nr:response regulator transcription factor [Bdellovibrio sp.]